MAIDGTEPADLALLHRVHERARIIDEPEEEDQILALVLGPAVHHQRTRLEQEGSQQRGPEHAGTFVTDDDEQGFGA
ncbi:MAG: hypothetical protein WKF94_10940 [Solirubrobacteraceae bacterium]